MVKSAKEDQEKTNLKKLKKFPKKLKSTKKEEENHTLDL